MSKFLEINCCEDCPHSRVKNKEGLEDSYIIICEHLEQKPDCPECTHKIKNGQRIYFTCPLNSDEDE